ncbi:hypothetical protein IRJ41_000682, partial [Triplophysa rosa]
MLGKDYMLAIIIVNYDEGQAYIHSRQLTAQRASPKHKKCHGNTFRLLWPVRRGGERGGSRKIEEFDLGVIDDQRDDNPH